MVEGGVILECNTQGTLPELVSVIAVALGTSPPVVVSMLSASCPAWVQGQTRVSVDGVGMASDVPVLLMVNT